MSNDDEVTAVNRITPVSASRDFAELEVDEGISRPSGTDDPNINSYIGPPGPDPNNPTYIGRFHIQSLIGKGGMGSVYRAKDLLLDRFVAVKKTNARGNLDDANLLSLRFRREIALSGKLDHPNIVRIFDVASHGDEPYMVMQLLKGRDLAGVLEIIGKFQQKDARVVFHIMAGVCLGAARIHAEGILHRDFKPSNVFVDYVGLQREGRIVDFGVARFLRETENTDPQGKGLTSPGGLCGTLGYMAPEQILGKPLSIQADQFALCVILYECFVGFGVRPYDTKPDEPSEFPRMVAMSESYKRGVKPWLDKLPGWLKAQHPEFCAMLARGLDPDPKRRFADTKELADLLSGFAQIPHQDATLTGVSLGNVMPTHDGPVVRALPASGSVALQETPIRPSASSPETFAPQTSDRIEGLKTMPGRLDRRLVGAGLLLGVVMASVVGLVLSRPPQHVAAGLPRTAEPSRLVDLPVDAGALIEEPDVGVLPSEDSGVPEDAGPSTVEDASRSVSSRNARRLSPRQQAERAAERRDNAAIDASRRLMNQMCCDQRVDHILTRNGSRIACRPAPRDWMANHCGGRR